MDRIGIIGAGAWGTGLATVARRAGRDVVIWAREPEVVTAINEQHMNPLFLPDVLLDAAIRAVDEPAKACAADAVLLVAPSQYLRAVAHDLAGHMADGVPVVICAKGIEQGSGALMTEVAEEAMPNATLAVLSGPTFAAEVARGLPTAVTLACADTTVGTALIDALGTKYFRPYLSDDLIGAEIGGAVKNVLAIACGIVTGRELGDNARAALITRGLAEMTRLGAAKGAKPETLMGLSGLGDLTLTCNGPQSRNMSLGIALGRGERLSEVLASRRSIAEGVTSSISVTELAARLGIEMPISAAVKAILHDGAEIDAVVDDLLARPFKAETLGV
ncbi:MAG: NAD(P)H-dependent glycerol-3-phosphate dehydrogenase [Alphaproteobacteria bacterium]|nr:NAD(P)H-dependent glycerol-3-phosphate dehydrogenase [Alphaproteobacteria bacterium]